MKRMFVLLLCFFLLAPDLVFAKKGEKSAPRKTEAVSGKKASGANKKSAKPKKNSAEKKASGAKKKSAKPKESAAEKKSSRADAKAAEPKKSGATQSKSKSNDPLSKKLFENFSVARGIVKLQSVMANGSVLLFIENGGKKQDSWMPVVEQNDLGESNYISLFIDGIEYRLNGSGKVARSFEAGSDFVTITYRVKRLAELKANYVISSRNLSGNADCVLVSYSIMNRDKKTHDFALKAVYNTILGERHESHFRTPSNAKVTSEYSFRASPSDNWVITSDGMRALCFSLYGDEITPPGNVVMANKNIIEMARPESVFVDGRSFTSVLAYNNSSLALFWEKFPIPPESEILYSYKINFSKSDFQNDAELLKPYEPRTEIFTEPEPESEVTVQESVPTPPPAPKLDDSQIDFETERNYLDPEKINPQYVQRLIDEINALEQTNPAVSREKIQALQSEINEVLEVLRSRR